MTCLKLNNEYYGALARDKQLNKMRAAESRFSSYNACFEQVHVMDPILVYSNSEVKIKCDFVPGSYSLSSGTRSYDSENTKWLSRDHINEQGGYNLYGFIGNDGVNKWDVLGKASRQINATFNLFGHWRGTFIWELEEGVSLIDTTPGWVTSNSYGLSGGASGINLGIQLWLTAHPADNSRWTTEGCEKGKHRFIVRQKITFKKHLVLLIVPLTGIAGVIRNEIDGPCVCKE